MIRWSSFTRSIAFAAAASLGWMPWLLVAGPFLGLSMARVVYLIAVAALYVAGLSPRPTRRVVAALAMVVAGTVLAVAARSLNELAFGLAVAIGLARGAFLHPAASPARAAAIEACLLGGGLVFARFLSGFAPPATAFALWGFLLVQSFFFLAGAERARRDESRPIDPFEEAYRRATALLERMGV